MTQSEESGTVSRRDGGSLECDNCGEQLDHLEHGIYKTCPECGEKTRKRGA